MEIFIGLDVSLASTAVCILGERGKILKEADVISEPEALVSFFKDLPGLCHPKDRLFFSLTLLFLRVIPLIPEKQCEATSRLDQ